MQGIALRLSQACCSVTIIGRNRERGLAVCEQMKLAAQSAHCDSSAKFHFIECDAQLLGNVRQCTLQITDLLTRSGDALDYLVLTQGMATIQGFTPTAEGIGVYEILKCA